MRRSMYDVTCTQSIIHYGGKLWSDVRFGPTSLNVTRLRLQLGPRTR